MPKFFIPESQICGDSLVLTRQAHHIADVLRLKSGDPLLACDGKGTDYACVITGFAADKSTVYCRIIRREACASEPACTLTLYQALVKSDKMDFIVQKGTEIGVSRFVPYEAARSIVRIEEKKAVSKTERWQKIASSAAEQCERGRIPTVSTPLLYDQAIRQACSQSDLVLFCYEQAQHHSLKKILQEQTEIPQTISVFIGPEGGFEPQEAALAETCGARWTGLGPRILRTETAGIVCVSVTLYELGQME